MKALTAFAMLLALGATAQAKFAPFEGAAIAIASHEMAIAIGPAGALLEASNGVEAIEVLEKHGGVDLVVSDVVMPEMDGPTLLRELRRRDPDVKIIFVSGYAEEAFRKNLPEGEKFTFLPKPFTLKELVAAVKEAMAS